MSPRKSISAAELFRSQLEQVIDLNHPLAKLSRQIDWSAFELEFGSLYTPDFGRPALPIRLLVGLTYLSRMFDLSDESVVEGWLENPYWQYFCGFEYFQHQFPLDPSSLVRWRKRIGKKGMEFLLQQTLVTAQRSGQLKKRHLHKINIDTTVQEKNITFPTDAKLFHRMCERLVKEARKIGIALRQSYVRVGKKVLIMQSRYAHAKQFKRAQVQTKRLKIILGRVVRDIGRKCAEPSVKLADLLALAERLLAQQKNDKNKLYSVHAPEVECIAKGKAHKRYEFGCKVGVATTSSDNWVIGVQALHGNPYDGHTLSGMLDQVRRITGWQPQEAYCDQGYRGHGYTGETTVHIVDRKRRRFSRTERKWRGRRAAIEPVIGHLKSDHRMDRNRLHGIIGDNMNSMLAGCGRNLRKLLQILLRFILDNQFFGRFRFQRAVTA
jgi:IS5 family transposase